MTTTITATVAYDIKPQQAKLELRGPRVAKPRGSCLLLHGWDSKGSDMVPLSDAIQQLPNAAGWSFYTSTYDTHLETFVEAAQDLYASSAALPQPLILIGYSEGAIVARQMISNGLKIKALLTICGPHLGLGTWIPTPDAGSASISPFSKELAVLNGSARDQQNRALYHMFAISCHDFWGDHNDDGVVPVPSALGSTLGPVAERVIIKLEYGSVIAGVDPYLRGMDPDNLQPVLTSCEQLLA